MYRDEICKKKKKLKIKKKASPRLGFVISALSSLGSGREDGDVERVTNEQIKTRFLVGGRRGFFFCCCCCCLWEIYTAAAAAAVAVQSRSGI